MMVYGMVFLPMTAEDFICSGIKEVKSLFFYDYGR